ncbi:MAG: hypothetical protein JRF40_11020 [Deltaproteobacteria bacterium]|nr:hypothetical protein [Deltaproteobacteria bacterium]
MFIAGMALLSVFLGTSTGHAARPDTAVCDGLSRNAFGIFAPLQYHPAVRQMDAVPDQNIA